MWGRMMLVGWCLMLALGCGEKSPSATAEAAAPQKNGHEIAEITGKKQVSPAEPRRDLPEELAARARAVSPSPHQRAAGLEHHDWQLAEGEGQVEVWRESAVPRLVIMCRPGNTPEAKTLAKVVRRVSLSDTGKITFSAYLAAEGDVPLKVALGLSEGPGFTWYQTQPVTLLPSQWTEVEFDLAASPFQGGAAPGKPADVRALSLIVQNGKRWGVVCIEKFQVPEREIAARPDPRVAAPKLPPSPLKGTSGAPLDGLESGNWSPETYANPLRLSVVQAQDRNKLLCLDYRAGDKDKVACKRDLRLSLAGEGKMRFAVYNDNPAPVRIALGVVTSEKNEWFESKAQLVKPGWNEIEFDLAAKEYQSKAAGWEFSAAIANRQDTRALVILVYTSGDGRLYLDGFTVPLQVTEEAPKAEELREIEKKPEEEDQKETPEEPPAAIPLERLPVN